MNPYLPFVGPLPIRRNARMPFHPSMAGPNPLMAMGSNSPMGLGLPPLQVARNGRYNPMYGGPAGIVGPGAFYNSTLNLNPNLIQAVLQRSYPSGSPALAGPIGYPYLHPNAYYGASGCMQCGNSAPDCCSQNDNSGEQKFKTKDVTVRGKCRKVRASFLIEAGKFEADLTKYMEKKKEEDVPDKVLEMLIGYINHEDYNNKDILDEVTMNILASNVGAKSAVSHSLERLKRLEEGATTGQIVKIIGTVLFSSKVEEGVKKWLKGFLKEGERWRALDGNGHWHDLIRDRPEAKVELERLLGLVQEPDDKYHRNL